jgi:hypothetical protein
MSPYEINCRFSYATLPVRGNRVKLYFMMMYTVRTNTFVSAFTGINKTIRSFAERAPGEIPRNFKKNAFQTDEN